MFQPKFNYNLYILVKRTESHNLAAINSLEIYAGQTQIANFDSQNFHSDQENLFKFFLVTMTRRIARYLSRLVVGQSVFIIKIVGSKTVQLVGGHELLVVPIFIWEGHAASNIYTCLSGHYLTIIYSI